MAIRLEKLSYTDGRVDIYTDAAGETSSGAPKNPETGEDLEFVVALPFGESQIRAQDMDVLQISDIGEAAKIRVPESGKVKAGMYGVIGRTLYYIHRADPNRSQRAVYLYMQEARHDYTADS